MNVTQCDSCRKIGPSPPAGWLLLVKVSAPESSFMAMLGGQGNGGADLEGTFCGYQCAGEYARARALIPETDGSQP